MDPEGLIPLNPRDYLILFSLVADERHGYGIVKQVEADSHGQVSIDPANLYRAIQRMVDVGLVEDAEPPADGGGERRRYYQITELGRRVVSADAERMRSLARAAEAEQLIDKSGRVS